MNIDTYTADILANLSLVKQRIQHAVNAAGRSPEAVQLLMATKTVSAEKIKVAIDAGEALIGENKVQELKEKDYLLGTLPIQRHFIGHLQTNKIKDVLRYANCIQSVDRPDLVEKLDSRLQFENRTIDIFVQVNTSFEESKFGVHPDEAIRLIEKVRSYGTMRIKGLMTIGLFDADPEKVKPSFRLLREIRDSALRDGLLSPDGTALSMGMSGDLETAIAEGATIVRVGTSIFGKRQYPDAYYWNENGN